MRYSVDFPSHRVHSHQNALRFGSKYQGFWGWELTCPWPAECPFSPTLRQVSSRRRNILCVWQLFIVTLFSEQQASVMAIIETTGMRYIVYRGDRHCRKMVHSQRFLTTLLEHRLLHNCAALVILTNSPRKETISSLRNVRFESRARYRGPYGRLWDHESVELIGE